MGCCASTGTDRGKELIISSLQPTLSPLRKQSQRSDPQIAELMISTIAKLELESGRPVYFIEITQELQDQHGAELPRPVKWLDAMLLYRDDLVLCNDRFVLFSLDAANQRSESSPEGTFELCSDRICRLYPTYAFDDVGRFRPGSDTETVNFDSLKELLLSKDINRYALLQQMTEDNKCVFLDGSVDLAGERVALQSFPSSGNTLMRRFIEQITGVFTGSDMPLEETYHEAMMGFLGQNTTCDSNLVWVTNTHHPRHTMPDSLPFQASKMIVIGRNPLDAIAHFSSFTQTSSHQLEINEQLHADHPEYWDEWVLALVKMQKENHAEVLDAMAARIPTYFMRYEDLMHDSQPTIVGLFQFLLDVPSLEGTIVERRIAEVCESGFKNETFHRPKADSQNISRCAYLYTEEQKRLMKTELAEMIKFWEYGNGSVTAFFDVNREENDVMTFKQYNKTKTLPFCGSLKSRAATLQIEGPERTMQFPEPVQAKVSIKQR